MRLFAKVGVILIVVLVVLEIGLRSFGVGRYVVYQPDPHLLWLPRPSQRARTIRRNQPITINSQGLRYSLDLGPRQPGEVRIYTFGDSITMGWGMDDSSHYSSVLERLLNERYPHSRYRVVSAGVNAYPTTLCVRRFAQLLAEGHLIDVAVLAYSFNSAMEPWTQLQGRDKQKFLRKVWLKGLLRRSASYNLLIEDLLRVSVYYRLRSRLVPGSWDVDSEKGKENLEYYLHSLEDMRNTAEHSGVRLVFLLLGSQDQEELNAHQRAFLEFAESKAIPTANMVEVLGKRNQAELFMFGDHAHPSQLGHELIAESLLPVVEQVLGSLRADF